MSNRSNNGNNAISYPSTNKGIPTDVQVSSNQGCFYPLQTDNPVT